MPKGRSAALMRPASTARSLLRSSPARRRRCARGHRFAMRSPRRCGATSDACRCVASADARWIMFAAAPEGHLRSNGQVKPTAPAEPTTKAGRRVSRAACSPTRSKGRVWQDGSPVRAHRRRETVRAAWRRRRRDHRDHPRPLHRRMRLTNPRGQTCAASHSHRFIKTAIPDREQDRSAVDDVDRAFVARHDPTSTAR